MKRKILSIGEWLALIILCAPSLIMAGDLEGQEDSISISRWSLLIKASSGPLIDSLAIFGVRLDATSDYDPAYDVPRPPDPPTDNIKVYFPHSGDNWPQFLGNKWMIDFNNPVSPHWLMEVESSINGIYITLSWDTTEINQLPMGYYIMAYDSQAATSFDFRSRNTYSFLYSGIRKFYIWIDIGFTTLQVNPRWNLVSLPVEPQNPLKSNIFKNAVSDAFYYDGGYISAESLEAGKGYWIKYDNAEYEYLYGLSVSSLSIPLIEGWNLIGVIDHDIPAPRGGILSSDFFGYDGSYYSTDTLRAGKGYWVKSSSNGILNLGDGSVYKNKSLNP